MARTKSNRTAAKSTKTAKSSKTAKTTKTAAKSTEKEVGTCLFSGQPTSSKRSRFLPGHDAKLKSVLLSVVRGEAAMSAVPAGARKVLNSGETLVGFKITDGGNLKAVGNFAVAAGKKSKKAAAAPAPEKKARRTRKAKATEEVAEAAA